MLKIFNKQIKYVTPLKFINVTLPDKFIHQNILTDKIMEHLHCEVKSYVRSLVVLNKISPEFEKDLIELFLLKIQVS